jgi:thioester reductase-like protein
VEFKTALFLPEGDGETKVQIRFDPGDNHFKVFSSAGDGAADWTLNSEGTIHAGIGTTERVTHDVEGIRRRCPVVEDARGHYHRIPEGTLNFGPMFQRLGYVWCGQGEALGEISASDELRWDIDRHYLHPCLLDACFQLTFGTIPDGARIYEGKVLLPVEIDRVTWFDKLPHEFLGYVRLKRSNLTTIETDLYAVDKEGRELVRIEGLRVQAAEGIPGEGKALDDLFYESKWFLKPLPREKRLTSPTPLSAFLSSADELKESLEARARALRDSSGVVDRYLEVEPMINRLCTGYLIDCFTALGWQPEAGERITLDDALQRMGIESRYLQYLRQSFGWLEGEGYFRRDEGADSREWMVVKPLRANETTDELWRESILHDPARLPEFLLLKRCGPNLPQILTGRIDPLNLLFESDTTHVLEHLYASATMSRGANEITKDLVGQLVRKIPKGRFLSVLEIGAGLGGSTSYLLPLLPKTQCRYTYTDISQNLLSLAEDRFRDYPFVEYEHLDIEKHPSDQGFHEGQYDLVIAAHVLHATANLRETLEHVKWLMAPGGLGITVEMDVPIRFVSFIFGLLDGWWRFKDHDLRADSPTLGRDEWIRLLEECGFIDPVAASVTDGKSESGLAVLLARREIAAGDEVTESVPADSVSMETDTNEHPATNPFWLIFADRRGTGDRLARLLEPRGHRIISVATGADYSRLSEDHYEIRLGDPEHMKRLLRETVGNDGTTCAGIVHLWCLDTPDTAGMMLEDLVDAQRLACHSILHLTQGLIDQNISGDSPPPLNLVTCNAQPVSDRDDPLSLAQTSVVGLARVISVEQPELQSRMVDLSDPQNERQLRDLASELLFADDGEREIALRQEGRFVQRIAGATTSGQTSSVSEDEDLGSYRLEPGKHFGLDELAFRPVARKAPGPGEIEISIAASGLNFRDVMKALGIYPSDAQDVSLLGDECAGHVTRVGTGVSGFQPGDRVVAVASGCFGSWATVEAVRAMPLPSGFTLEEGATLLIAYGTAYHALHTLGQMSKGERVLIHAGAGGVGLAAVQLAMAAGAEVFATAGSPLKRDFLRGLGVDHVMDSRSLDFADEIMQITRGEGIDIVLNSLAGQAIARSLELLRVDGRFLEIGKRDIYGGTRISLKPFRNSLSYMAIDLARLMDPSRIEPLFAGLRKSFESGAVRPLPHRVFPMSGATDALRYMAKAHHIGKVVLSTEGERLTPVPTPSTLPLKLRTDATYLVIGGLRGLGLAFAEWLADRGARHLVLTSRTGLTRDDAREGVARLQSLGVEVWAVASDAGSEKDLAELLDRIRQSMPPLRGVVHSPLVLSDRMLDQEDVENFELPMRAKVYGAWNLHLQTKEIPLDFFVLVSSMSSIIGNPGQANYAAANAFEDALAHYRSRSGLPALSFNLGRLSGVGYLNRSKELDDFFQRIGWASLSPSKVFSAVERLLVNGATQMVVTNVNWPAFLRKSGFGKNSTRYELLLGAEEEGESRIASIREELFAAAPQDRPAIIERFMRQQVAKVLRLSAAKLDPNRPLTELGLDSLAGVELLARLESQIGMSTSPTRLMKNATLSQLAETMLIAVMGEGSAGPPTDGLRRPETQLDADDLDIATTADETDRARAESEAAREAAGVDPAADALLGETVPLDGESFDIDLLSNPKAVLLTGASGSLGVHLLAELLSQTTADVYSLVRAESEEEGWQRLREKFDTHRVTIPNDRLERVKIVLGDLAKPRLGWSRARFEELSERIDVVYHNGADVNLLLPYPILRSTNVLGTREVLALAGSRRLKAVHFTSSIGVFSDKDAEDGSTITESRLPGSTVRYTSGYGESKRVAEVMARTVGNLGLPITIHRPGLLLGNPRTGVTGPTDFLPLLLKTCIEFGQAPNSGTNLYLTPVDYAARSLVWLSSQPVSLGRISHLIGANRISLNDLISLARQMGYEIRTVEFDDWAKELTRPAIQRMNHPFAPFLSDQYLDRVSAIRLIVNTQMSINDDATRRSLAPSRIECPTLDASALAAYFDYFITIGFFPAPGRGPVSAADLSR